MAVSFSHFHNLCPRISNLAAMEAGGFGGGLESDVAFLSWQAKASFEFDIPARILVSTPEFIRYLPNPKREPSPQLSR